VQRKREREKARHASMTQEQRDEKNKKLREKYHREKDEKNIKRRERYDQKKAGKPADVFMNSVLPFLVYLIYSDVYFSKCICCSSCS
jgi:hypothetical protein